MGKQKYFPTDTQIEAIISKPYINSAILEKKLNLPKKYIQRLRNQYGIFPKNKHIDVEEFIEKYDELQSSEKVANYFEISSSYAKKFAKAIGYVNNAYKISDEIKKLVVEDYNNGISNSKILLKHQISQTSLYRILKEKGITANKDKKNYHINEHIFDSIDSDIKAYFVGFVAADGSISETNYTLSITISKKDDDILLLFQRLLETDKPLKYFSKNKDGKMYEYVQLVITNKQIVESLININLHQRKTWGNTIADINPIYFRSFIRGYFDGDGCVTNLKHKSIDVSITGYENNMNKIISFLNMNNIFASFIPDKREYGEGNGRFGSLYFTNNTQRYCFLKLLYQDDNNIHLDRKYQKAQKFISDIESSNKIIDKQTVIYYKYAVCATS